jgi:predicted ferric reductase
VAPSRLAFRSRTEALVTLDCSAPWAKAGSHAFLWLPQIQALQSHPYTIVSVHPVTFIVCGREGFTKDLHRHASTLTKVLTSTPFDPAYGAMPPFEKYNRVFLVAGGSGATWAIGVAVDLLSGSPQSILELAWVVRDGRKSSSPMLFISRSCD